MLSLTQKFRTMCLEVLDKDGHRNGNVWSLATNDMSIVYDAGRLVVQDNVDYITVWDDRLGGASTALARYYKMLERRLILDRLADV